jgi:hypothetical protein
MRLFQEDAFEENGKNLHDKKMKLICLIRSRGKMLFQDYEMDKTRIVELDKG